LNIEEQPSLKKRILFFFFISIFLQRSTHLIQTTHTRTNLKFTQTLCRRLWGGISIVQNWSL